MERSELAKPAKVVWHDLTCTANAKLDFVNVTKLFQNVNKHFGVQKRWKLVVLGQYRATIFKPRLLFECGICAT